MNDDDRRQPEKTPGRAKARYEATLHRGPRHEALKEIPGLDLDPLPGPPGETRVLMSIEDAARLVELGFEVHLLQAHPIRPLDGSRIPSDDEARAWLDERLQGVKRQGGD